MQQRSQAQGEVRAVLLQRDRLLQDDQRVFVDVLVPVVLVTLQPQGRQLGQNMSGEPGVDEQAQPLSRVRGEEELVQFVPDPLGRDDLDPPGHLRHGGDDLGGDLEVQLCGEPGGPHHAQGIVRERLLGRTRRPQDTSREILQSAVGVDELLRRQRHGHRVDREVAADQVLLDGVAVRHLRLARGAVVGLGPVGGDLDLVAALVCADRAEGDAHLPDGVRPGPDDLQYVLGAGVGGEVQVVAEPAEQRVADRSTDQGEREARLLESAGEVVGDGGHPQQLGDRALLRLAQGRGSVFVRVRHNRRGYVPGAIGGAPITTRGAPVTRCGQLLAYPCKRCSCGVRPLSPRYWI